MSRSLVKKRVRPLPYMYLLCIVLPFVYRVSRIREVVVGVDVEVKRKRGKDAPGRWFSLPFPSGS